MVVTPGTYDKDIQLRGLNLQHGQEILHRNLTKEGFKTHKDVEQAKRQVVVTSGTRLPS